MEIDFFSNCFVVKNYLTAELMNRYTHLGPVLRGKTPSYIRINMVPKQGSKFCPIRVAPNEEGDGLRLSHEKAHPLPSWTE